jgi:hypothetical protein
MHVIFRVFHRDRRLSVVSKWFIRQVVLLQGRWRCLAPFADDDASTPTRTDGDACSRTPSPAPRPHLLVPNTRIAVLSKAANAAPSTTAQSDSGTPRTSAGTRTPNARAPTQKTRHPTLGEPAGCPGWPRHDPISQTPRPPPAPGSPPTWRHSASRRDRSTVPPRWPERSELKRPFREMLLAGLAPAA